MKLKYSLRNIVHKIKKKAKATWIGHILLGKGFLQQVIGGKIGGTARGGTKRKPLLDDHKEKRGYWKLKEEAPVHTVWRTCFGRGYGSVVRQAKSKVDSSFGL
jgi:hypothetical protein